MNIYIKTKITYNWILILIFKIVCLIGVSHGMMPGGPMNPGGPVMAPPPPPQSQGNGPGGGGPPGHHSQANSPSDAANSMAMQQQNQQQPGGPGSAGAGGQGPPQGTYYGPPTTSQMPNVAEAKFNAAMNAGGPPGVQGTQQSMSPHMQQNGFGNAPPGQAPPPGSYGQQVQAAPPQTANNAPQGNVNNSVAPSGQGNTTGGVAAGTWGSSTLTYTQSMQPPDPRAHMGSYCKYNNSHKFNKY